MMGEKVDLYKLTAHELRRLLKKGEISYKQAVLSYTDRISSLDKHINSFISTSFDLALKKADELQKRQQGGENLPSLAGIPFAVKDNLCVKNTYTTCASNMLSGYRSPYTATAVKKLLEQDAVFLGKLNMDEFAMGGSSETSFYRPVRNPFDTNRVPGGSSGGSAAAVAAGFACFSLGSDTGGSVRQPASFCGVVGLKPTYARVSRYGLIAFASSLDQIGPITKDINDSALILETISGHDENDMTSSRNSIGNYFKDTAPDISGTKIAVFEEFFSNRLDPFVKSAVQKSLAVLSDLGASIDTISFPVLEYAIPAYYIISSAEASSNLARYDGIKYAKRSESFDSLIDLYIKSRSEGFGQEVKRRIMLGTYALSSGYYDAYYLKAVKVRDHIRGSLENIFNSYDAVIGPVAPTTAYGLGDKIDDPLAMYLGDIYTVTANIAGCPAISVPAGFDDKGMPVGLQIMCSHFEEEKLFDIARAYEKVTDHAHKIPQIGQENQN